MTSIPRLLVTGATGQLGSLVVGKLLESVSPSSVAVLARRAESASRFADRGVDVRIGDYDDASSLKNAFTGVDRLLFISSIADDSRVAQHRNVVGAAVAARVGLVAYTSVLHADTSPLRLADDHRATEAMLAESGLACVLLRNGWYTENYLAGLAPALERGVLSGAAGDGRIASATRDDYAAAAAAVLLAEEPAAGAAFELAGDEAFTLPELAAEIARRSGRPVRYENIDGDAYEAALTKAGMPPPLAAIVADADVGAARGALFDDGRALSRLIKRATTPMAMTVGAALSKRPD